MDSDLVSKEDIRLIELKMISLINECCSMRLQNHKCKKHSPLFPLKKSILLNNNSWY